MENINIPTRCETCGAQTKEWWHGFTPGLFSILVKVVRQIKKDGSNDYNFKANGELTNNEFSNFPKLRVHGLVAPVTSEDGGRKAAHWLLTAKAGKFLRGEISIPRRVKTFRGRVTGHSEDLVHVTDFRNKVSWYQNEFDFEIHEGKVVV